MTKKLLATILISLSFLAAPAFARETGSPRIRYVVFNNNAVTLIAAALGVSTMVQFQGDEIIETISAGDTKGWSIVPKKGSSILFVKPLEPGAETNLNVVTSKRVYALLFRASQENADRASFQVRFRYPEDEAISRATAGAARSAQDPDLKSLNPAELNYDYVYKGSDRAKPRVVFDNGTKTFFEFGGDVPAIFVVGTNKAETLVNYRREGRFIVVDKIGAQFTLRAGEDATCIFNRKAWTPPPPDEVEMVYGPRKAEEGFLSSLSLTGGSLSGILDR